MRGIPIPMPIFAPLDRPLLVGVGDGLAVTVTSAGAKDVRRVVPVGVIVAAEKLARSELCHMIGIPSPYIFQVASVTVVVRRVDGTTHSLFPFSVGCIYDNVDVLEVKEEWQEWPSPS